jgi:hypothetical protein
VICYARFSTSLNSGGGVIFCPSASCGGQDCCTAKSMSIYHWLTVVSRFEDQTRYLTAVCILSRFTSAPTKYCHMVVKRVFRYLQGTVYLALEYCGSDIKMVMCLRARTMQAIRTHEIDFWKGTFLGICYIRKRCAFATREYTPTQVHFCCDAPDVVTASSGAKHGTGSVRCARRSAFGQPVALFPSTFSLSCYRHLNLGLCPGQKSQVHWGRCSMRGGLSDPTSGGISFHFVKSVDWCCLCVQLTRWHVGEGNI